MPNRCVYLVADGERARAMVRRAEASGYDVVLELDSAAAHQASRDMLTERPGRTFDRVGPQRHAMEPRTNPKEDAKQAFAAEVAQALNGMVAGGQVDHLVLVAPSRTITAVREALDGRAAATVIHTLAKDLTKLPSIELFAVLDGLPRRPQLA